MSSRLTRIALLSLSCLALALLPGAAPAAPMCDVPADHPAASDVRMLWELGVVRGTGGGRFRGNRQIRQAEAVCLAARLTLAINEELVRRSGESVDATLSRWAANRGHSPDNPYPAGHWAAREWEYLRAVRPEGVDVLDGWPDPLPTRYEAAMGAARILRRARDAAHTPGMAAIESELDEVGAESNETEPLDWLPSGVDDHGPEGGDPGDPVFPMGPGGGGRPPAT